MEVTKRAAALTRLIESHEGRISHMYVDTKGNVTVGVGHLIENAQAAAGLPFWHEGVYGQPGLQPASPAATEAEYARVRALKVGPSQARLASLYMRDCDINALRDADLKVIHDRVLHQLPGLDALPDNAYLACMDIAFNCGSLVEWPRLVAAIKAGDWDEAARESNRPAVGAARNAKTAALLVSCAPPDVQAA